MNNNLLETIESSKDNLLIIGKAGVGKSTLIKVLKKNLGKQCIVVCPTGIAAQNVLGQTINSFFRIPPRQEMKFREIQLAGEKLGQIFKTELADLNTIIIDEISMVNQFVLESISQILKAARANNSAFGGMRMIFIGDLFQLPPVDVGGKIGDNIFFWHSQSYKTSEFKCFELNRVYRQEDNEQNQQFLKTLDHIRLYTISQNDLNILNSKISVEINLLNHTILCTKNEIAQAYNNKGLNELTTKEYRFAADITGNWSRQDFPKDSELIIKIGAPVLFMRNDPSGKYQNGTRAIVTEISAAEKKIKVQLADKSIIDVDYLTWAHPKYNKAEQNETIIISDSFKHFPIILGFALTIHRCQGMSLDNVHLDIGTGAFAPGQLYVALSRLRNFNGLTLARPVVIRDVIKSNEIAKFYSGLNPIDAQLNLNQTEISNISKEGKIISKNEYQNISPSEMSRILFKKGRDIEDIQIERTRLGLKIVQPSTIIGHILEKYEDFKKEELDRIIPISDELEKSVVSQLSKMTINELTTLTEIKNKLIEKDLDWNALKLIGYKHNYIQRKTR